MAYGITSQSQLIDMNAIQAGCTQYKSAVSDFEKCGDLIIKASEICTEKALSADGASLQYQIEDLGVQIKNLYSTFAGYADQVVADAAIVYNNQVAELNEYLRQVNAQKNNNQ